MGIRRKKSLLEQAGETVAAVAGTVASNVGSTVGDVAEFVETKLGDVVDSAKEAVAAEEPSETRKGGKLKKVLLLGVVAAVGGVLFTKVKGAKNAQSANWQSNYVPKPPPAASDAGEKLAEGAHEAKDAVADAAEDAKDNVTDLAEKAADKAAEAKDKAVDAARDATD